MKEEGNEYYMETNHEEQDKICLGSPPKVFMTSPRTVETETLSNNLKPADEHRLEDYHKPQDQGQIRNKSVEENKSELLKEGLEGSNPPPS